MKNWRGAYGRPVDVEFAWDDGRLYLLQCRTLSMQKKLEPVNVAGRYAPASGFFSPTATVLPAVLSKTLNMWFTWTQGAYNQITRYEEKVDIGHVVGKINGLLMDKRYALFGPGRWGSNDINLGVRVGYEDINNTLALGEIAFEADGSTPGSLLWDALFQRPGGSGYYPHRHLPGSNTAPLWMKASY